MNLKAYFSLLLLLVTIVPIFFLSACSSSRSSGQFINDKMIERINNEVTKRKLRTMIGTPSFIGYNDDDTWYYISRFINKSVLYGDLVKSQRILRVKFKNNKVIATKLLINKHNDDIIPYDGHTELYKPGDTVLKKFVRNIGRFRDQDKKISDVKKKTNNNKKK